MRSVKMVMRSVTSISNKFCNGSGRVCNVKFVMRSMTIINKLVIRSATIINKLVVGISDKHQQVCKWDQQSQEGGQFVMGSVKLEMRFTP
jgi:hypothetical protein